VFPYRDENETVRTPVVTFALIAANIFIYFYFQGAGMSAAFEASICNWGLIPGELTQLATPGVSFPMGDVACEIDPGREPLHLISAMFLHGGFLHLAGNMWFLWLFGNNIEDSMGRFRFLVFYLLCGLIAALAHVVTDASSVVPMVGASGAISGVMGAYIVLYPRVRVYCLVVIIVFITTIAVPAWVMLGYWMLLQVMGGFNAAAEGGVAFWAHIGGFAAGVLLIKVFSRPEYIRQHRSSHWRPSRLGMDRSRWS
jgi:membrane associated rhomboid family serine protease